MRTGLAQSSVIDSPEHTRSVMEPEVMMVPLLAQVLLTLVVGWQMQSRRLAAVAEGFDWRYFKTFEGERPPRHVLQADQHFVNLFELPVLFFAAALAAMALDLVDQVALALAFLFVALRGWHAWIALGANRLSRRRWAYQVGWAAVLALWGWVAYAALA